jgi:subtilisin family serine protease
MSRPLTWPACVLIVVLAAALVSACGGGGDSPAPIVKLPLPCNTASFPASTPPGGANPLLIHQWYLINTGQSAFASDTGTSGEDIYPGDPSITETGSGVAVRVVDTGLEIAHEDLAANVQPGASHNFLTGGSDPTDNTCGGDHGTSVAGLIAMVAGNNVGGQGVAPDAGLQGYNYLLSQSAVNFTTALGCSVGCSVGAFNQSFGTTNNVDFPISATQSSVYETGTTSGRGGLGTLYTKAAGNGFFAFGGAYCGNATALGLTCQNANMDPSNAEPWNIVVGAVNAKGERSSYSTAGSAIWVSATGGEFGYNSSFIGGYSANAYSPAMVTTDQSGCDKGYSVSASVAFAVNDFEDGHALNDTCNYTSTFNGTSSATPVLSGVIALLLEANSGLTWRDVKHILATTADSTLSESSSLDGTSTPTMVDIAAPGDYTAEQGWVTNTAGYMFHNWYGFGRVDAGAAVALAKTYVPSPNPWPALINSGWVAGDGTNLAIPDGNPTGVPDTATVSSSGIGFIEAVQVRVTVTHPYIQVVAIELTSPGATKSILLNIANGFNSANLSNMVLLSNAFYGETVADDTWTLRVIDGDGGTPDNGVLNSWSIKVWGH